MQGAEGKGRPGGLVGIDDVAVMLGVGVRHVRRLVADRRIPYLKWGHLLRFDPVEIEAWLEKARRPVSPEVVAVPALRIGGARRVRRWQPPDAG
ncbi:MAG: helix-turn-helix domain-containing protein [Acidimicrobiia bacterium]